jgi:TolA-binding protein
MADRRMRSIVTERRLIALRRARLEQLQRRLQRLEAFKEVQAQESLREPQYERFRQDEERALAAARARAAEGF